MRIWDIIKKLKWKFKEQDRVIILRYNKRK